MKHDYTKWSLGCLVREVGREFPGIDKRHSTFYDYTRMASDIKDHVYPDGDERGFRAQWLLGFFLQECRRVMEHETHPAYRELQRRLKEDQKERGVFDTAT